MEGSKVMEVAQLLEQMKEHADALADLIKKVDANIDDVAIIVSKDGYKDVTAFYEEEYESLSKFSYQKDWEYAKRKRRRFLKDLEEISHEQ
jgi:hypothetical protein